MKNYYNYYPSYKDIVLDSGKLIFQQQLDDFEGKKVLVDGVRTKALIQYHTNPLSDETEDRKITCWKSIDLKLGSYVRILEEKANYIVFSRVKYNDLIKYGKIIHCNHILTYQDPDTLEIHKIPCFAGDKTSVYSTGIGVDDYFTMATDQIMILVQDNEVTRKIPKNHRIIFRHNTNEIFEITRIDGLTQDGIISFRAKHSLYDANTDNLEFNIVDYVEPPEESEPPENGDNGEPPEEPPEEPEPLPNITIEIEGKDKIDMTENGIYTVKVYEEGEPVYKSVIFSVDDTSLANIKSQGSNQCELVANMNFNIGNVTLRATWIENEEIFGEKIIGINQI